MDNWDELRTAFQVVKAGTVSGAADALGVHHATVIRHIDALEGRLGVKLFQRHPRGYTPTEAGEDLARVARTTDDQFSQLEGRLREGGNAISGDLVVTSLSSVSPLLTPALARFHADNPELVIRYLTGARLFRLEYGEAHVAIRAGAAPQEPDNVVQPFFRQAMRLVATQGYIDRHGRPESYADLAHHRIIGDDDPASRAPFSKWMRDTVPADRIVFRTTDNRVMAEAVRAGIGIGFLSGWRCAELPDLVELFDPLPEWEVPLWIVTHVDLHRTAKVQAIVAHLKSEAEAWMK